MGKCGTKETQIRRTLSKNYSPGTVNRFPEDKTHCKHRPHETENHSGAHLRNTKKKGRGKKEERMGRRRDWPVKIMALTVGSRKTG